MKVGNEYSDQIGPLFAECPKHVLGAIAVSALTQGGDYLVHAGIRVAREWQILYEAGIVSQRPSANALSLAKQAEATEEDLLK